MDSEELIYNEYRYHLTINNLLEFINLRC